MQIVKAFTLLSVMFSLIFSSFDFAPEQAAASEPVTYQVYEVVIEGTAGGRWFRRQGSLFVTPLASADTGAAGRPVHIWLVSGNPAVTAETGAIWLGTTDTPKNQLETTAVPGMYIANDQIQVNFLPDNMPGSNVFSFSGNVEENAGQLINGQMQLQLLPNGQMLGSIDVLFFDASGLYSVPYKATISGHHAGTRAW